MPPRHSLPSDDLYARLEVPVDASFEAIEIAWRALLKQHHPDVAGPDGLERAKRINVAHDWLANPELLARYDRERGHVPRRPSTSARSAGWSPRSQPGGPTARRPPAWSWSRTEDLARDPGARTERADPEVVLRRFVERVGRLGRDELDRLSVADPPPIAFVASIRRFLAPERLAALREAETRIREVLGAAGWASPPIRDAVLAAAHEIVLAPFFDEHLGEPYRSRARDRLTRAWEAAIDQPRYGPNTTAVLRVVERAALMTEDELGRLVRASGRRRLPDDPWPRGIDPEEDEVFRVSSLLAARDVAGAPGAMLERLDRAAASRARRVLARTAHAHVLRHAFTSEEFGELVAPWRIATGDPGTGRGAAGIPNPTVRRA